MNENSIFIPNIKNDKLRLQNQSAIVVDYDCYLAQNLAEILELNGVKVMSVGHSGRDAIQLYYKFETDLVVIDLGTTWDGILAVETIKTMNPKVLIVAIAFTDDQRLNRLRGKAAILFKPFDVTSFIQACSKKNQREELSLVQ